MLRLLPSERKRLKLPSEYIPCFKIKSVMYAASESIQTIKSPQKLSGISMRECRIDTLKIRKVNNVTLLGLKIDQIAQLKVKMDVEREKQDQQKTKMDLERENITKKQIELNRVNTDIQRINTELATFKMRLAELGALESADLGASSDAGPSAVTKDDAYTRRT